MADEEGFEPPLRCYRKHDFESRAFSHSATHPQIYLMNTSIKIKCLNMQVFFSKYQANISR